MSATILAGVLTGLQSVMPQRITSLCFVTCLLKLCTQEGLATEVTSSSGRAPQDTTPDAPLDTHVDTSHGSTTKSAPQDTPQHALENNLPQDTHKDVLEKDALENDTPQGTPLKDTPHFAHQDTPENDAPAVVSVKDTPVKDVPQDTPAAASSPGAVGGQQRGGGGHRQLAIPCP